MYSYSTGNPLSHRRTRPLADAEPRSIPETYKEPRSSIPVRPEFSLDVAGDRIASAKSTSYTLVSGEPRSRRDTIPRTSPNNSASPPSRLGWSSGACCEPGFANEDKELPLPVPEEEAVAQASSSDFEKSIPSQSYPGQGLSTRTSAMGSCSTLVDQDGWHQGVLEGMTGSVNDGCKQGEAARCTRSTSTRSLHVATRRLPIRGTRVTSPLLFAFNATNGGDSDRASSPLLYQDLNFFGDYDGRDETMGTHEGVKGGRESFTLPSTTPQEMDIASSGEESFVFNSQSPPSFDMGSQQKIEDLVLEIGQDLIREFVSYRGGMAVHTPQSSQESPTSSNGGIQATSGSCSSNKQVNNVSGSSGKNKRRKVDGDDESRKPQRPRIESPILEDLDAEGLLACPYAKYDPNRYSEMNPNLHEKAYRRCRSVCLTSIPRLKQHLYRVHRRPEYFCSSCYTEFESESDGELHARARPACDLKDCPFEEKMTHEQYKAVKRRKMRKDTTSVWYGIFDILFPDAQRPGTPYVEDANSPPIRQYVRDYNVYLEAHLPQRLSERMGGPLFGGDPMMFQWLVNMALEETLPTVLRELHDTYQTLGSVEGAKV
ncbi:hypothetical protein AYO21_04735 [Fonsecaea monophora]|uniref:C2H2-type domain-containing protein n=1 Tax=Fonsecaea monophora TaxID=254056 RepID=A0A177FCE4_9EURO|nr:hypothetical protein AYO21_04735 [Fonsecaea monophora]KAH0839142.1 hypothetical protein FOPE_05381 [Fonsecaea pedrosoi]OAG41122.1 hypothetical protein AYO21_04735 [Fonsecaea monophora]